METEDYDSACRVIEDIENRKQLVRERDKRQREWRYVVNHMEAMELHAERLRKLLDAVDSKHPGISKAMRDALKKLSAAISQQLGFASVQLE